ncbi:DUF6789 family protein [Prosthecobacter sp.]|uniref:DUF6789 family protein n=1 Tax=Prosthecobacter sp. TaxID=1965333 RepID=UPI002ABABA1B|nr:DUF6789 family protein [Prosthecobacter sp.]MDZ4403181.1 DUF6789 family protein [Prosthecobacter sp.]
MEENSSPKTWLLAVGVITASLSGVALLLHAFAGVHLAFTVIVMTPLTVVLLAAMIAGRRIQGREVFLQRVWGGAFAGLMGLIAYDVIRWLIMLSGMVPFNPFRAIEVFGLLILKSDVDTPLTKTVGWLFHTWNGLTFAIMFTLAFGRGKIWQAVVWSLVLEAAMIVTYPSMLRVKLDWPFLSISIIGHIAYGLALGYTARGAVKR